MSFINQMKQVLDQDLIVTENSATGYRTTGKALLDLNFAVASLRNASDREIISHFIKAYAEDKTLSLTWLFFARDIREGLGERRLFRVIFRYLANNINDVPGLIHLVPEYGRFDDLLCLLQTSQHTKLIAMINTQLTQDIKNMNKGAKISLLAKWLPSINASNSNTRNNARAIASGLNMNWKTYRKTLSALRKYLDIVEQKISAKAWQDIKYEAVPSKANLLYHKAFFRQDEARRMDYLTSLRKGETKINAGALYPHEIVHSYMFNEDLWRIETAPYNETLEQLWQALPTISDMENTIVVADGSGSMTVPVGNTGCSALSVANALAIYFAQHSQGEFHNKYITFSHSPQLVDLSQGSNLQEKLQIALAYNEVANTDIQAVFELILNAAITGEMPQELLPKNILLISDMEFDSCTQNAEARPFAQIQKAYAQQGYKLPRLVFWNVNSRTNAIPVRENDLGVALVSGFSIAIAKMVMSQELDPYQCLCSVLDASRYDPIRQALTTQKSPYPQG